MSFPHYIESKNVGWYHVVLWQLNHYHYEIEFTGGRTIDLAETPYEDAMKQFNETEVILS